MTDRRKRPATVIAALLLGLVCACTAPTLDASVCGARLFALVDGSTELHELDQHFGDSFLSLPLTIPGGVVTGAHAIAGNTLDGELYIFVELGALSESILGVVDVDSGVVTIIGGTGQTFVGMTIDGNGTAYGVTGENVPQPETLFTVDLLTGAATISCAFGTSDTGEVIEALPYDMRLLHVSGGAGAYDPITDTGTWFESIQLGSATPCASTPLTPDPLLLGARCTALAALPSGQVVWKEGEGAGPLHFLDPYSGMLDYTGYTIAVKELAAIPFCPPQPYFLRGDTNDDGAVNIADAILILQKLFDGGPSFCEGAEDVNDDFQINIADAIRLLGYLFANGPPPPGPFPQCEFAFASPFVCVSASCP